MSEQARLEYYVMTDDQRKELIDRLYDEKFEDIEINGANILCKCMVEEHLIKLRCVLPPTFPYELPTIFIEKNSYDKISPLPHINIDLSICNFNSSIVIPDFKFPISIICVSFIESRKVIRQGILKENIDDFQEEFNAYWKLECDTPLACVESIVESPDTPCILSGYFSGKKIYLANNKMCLDKYLYGVGINKRFLKDYFECVYLPLMNSLIPPFPKTNYEWYCLINDDKENTYVYNQFIKKNHPGCAFIAFSVPYKERRTMQLFMHTSVTTKVNGFRKGHVPVKISYLKSRNGKNPLRFSITDMSQGRLYNRGGVGLTKQLAKIAIIGCGSVGSYIAEALSEYGVSSFVLVDNEALSTENIARHYCGYEYIGTDKVTAIKKKLCKHNPNIQTVTYVENGLLFMKKHTDILNSCDMIFVATATTPLEYRIVEMHNNGEISKPIVITWVEPFLAAAHALILNKPQDIYKEIFDSNFLFKKKVITNSSDFLMKEVGCQSTFVPYAAFSLKQYIYAFLNYLVYGNVLKGKSGNYLFTWCGDLQAAQERGCIVAKQWKDVNNFSNHVKRID